MGRVRPKHMRKHTFVTALPTRLAALAALGLLITACGNESSEVGSPAPETDESAPAPETDKSTPIPEGEEDESTPAPEEEDDEASEETDADVELTIERTVSGEDGLAPESGFEEGTWTLTCSPADGDHPDPEAACAEIEEVGTEPFVMDTTDRVCTMQIGGPEEAHVTGHVYETEIDTEFNKRNGCEINRFGQVHTVLNP